MCCPYTGNSLYRTQSKRAGYGGRGVTLTWLAIYTCIVKATNHNGKDSIMTTHPLWMLIQEMTSTGSEAGYV